MSLSNHPTGVYDFWVQSHGARSYRYQVNGDKSTGQGIHETWVLIPIFGDFRQVF